ncbi:hypothetical protein [Salinicola rhizosphaerae]|uniref:Preprotein translocase subunit SecY n=1 Tax=Salinicola rhizosphaerae TaxID=1443141 RepID=A0ABQ3DRD3_9GAMM|nr:hypothetical protein [Salinicola rhizosphaerae]GHB12970.1 hypothetical protein GCM10009038_08780 [Salinicola rhizosphaerae]
MDDKEYEKKWNDRAEKYLPVLQKFLTIVSSKKIVYFAIAMLFAYMFMIGLSSPEKFLLMLQDIN